jgi:hypothetical protein
LTVTVFIDIAGSIDRHSFIDIAGSIDRHNFIDIAGSIDRHSFYFLFIIVHGKCFCVCLFLQLGRGEGERGRGVLKHYIEVLAMYVLHACCSSVPYNSTHKS